MYKTLALLAFLVVGACGLRAEVIQDAVIIGAQRYVRTDRIADDLGSGQTAELGESALAARSGTCTVVMELVSAEFESIFRRGFSGWNTPATDACATVPGAYSANDLAVATTADTVAGIWPWNTRAELYVSQAPCSALGVQDSILREHSVRDVAVCSNADGFAVLAGGQRSGGGGGDAAVKLYSPAGEPTSVEIIVRSTPPSTGVSDLSIVSSADGALLVGYAEGANPPSLRLYVRRINADLSMEPRVMVSDQPVWTQTLQALSGETTLCMFGRYPRGSGTFAQALDVHGAPIGAPISLEPEIRYGAMAATSDGRMVIGNTDGTTAWIRVYGADGVPVDERFYFPSVGGTQHSFIDVQHPLAYEDDGTIWILWVRSLSTFAFQSRITQLRPFDPGDMNYDRVVDNGDIDAFVLALTAPEVYESLYPGVPFRFIGDMNEDGAFDNGDIDGFVDALLE